MAHVQDEQIDLDQKRRLRILQGIEAIRRAIGAGQNTSKTPSNLETFDPANRSLEYEYHLAMGYGAPRLLWAVLSRSLHALGVPSGTLCNGQYWNCARDLQVQQQGSWIANRGLMPSWRRMLNWIVDAFALHGRKKLSQGACSELLISRLILFGTWLSAQLAIEHDGRACMIVRRPKADKLSLGNDSWRSVCACLCLDQGSLREDSPQDETFKTSSPAQWRPSLLFFDTSALWDGVYDHRLLHEGAAWDHTATPGVYYQTSEVLLTSTPSHNTTLSWCRIRFADKLKTCNAICSFKRCHVWPEDEGSAWCCKLKLHRYCSCLRTDTDPLKGVYG